MSKEKTKWYNKDAEFALKKLNTTENGLSQEEASKRLKECGENVLPQKKPKSFLLMLLSELVNPIIIILLFAMAFSFVVGELLDAFVILGIILIDAIMGAVQEKRAQRIAKSLSGMIKVKVKVVRDGEKKEIDSKNLVPGDIVFLESGDKVSADMRIINCSNFTLDEALLTGESVNATKSIEIVKDNAPLGDRTCMVFSGSSVITGRAMCVVVETALNTEIGNIANNLNNVEDEKSPLNIRIAKFSKQISVLIVLISVLIFIIMLVKNNPLKEIFLVVIALAVSAMPEGLPLAVTMALTIASNRMGKNNVVVKHLNAVESLGSCTVIATDKTGTLTLNEQTAKVITLPSGEEFEISGSGYNDQGEIICNEEFRANVNEIALMGFINNESQVMKNQDKFEYFGDSMDVAFKFLGLKAKVNKDKLKIKKQIPYESENKYSAVYFEKEGKTYCTVKGSLEKIIEFSSTMNVNGEVVKLDVEKVENQNKDLAKRGYRVLALAVGEIDNESITNSSISKLTFIGLVSFIDPVREETKGAIESCHKAGIKVIMVTGDHPLTAYKIAKDINIANNYDEVATGTEVEKAFKKGESEFDKFVKEKTVFSRVTPTDKLNIVNSLKRQGEFVAVTGDGVNDSPAIKTAHIGIAMGSGTDVSKETADMIILDDNFSSIVKGVKEGRTAYSNIRKITYFLLTCSFAEVLFFMIAMILGVGTPLLPIQLLWLNVITDGFQDMALSLEGSEPDIMDEKPRSTKESLFTKSMVSQCVFMGSVIGLIVVGAWLIFNNVLKFDVVVSRSLIMALMVFMQNIHALNCKSEDESLFKTNMLKNWFFLISVIASIGIQILFMEVKSLSKLLDLTTVSYKMLLILIAVSLIVFVACELYKLVYRQIKKKANKKMD